MLHAKYECFSPYGLSQEDFKRFLLTIFVELHPRNIPAKFLSRLAFWFWRRRFLKKLLTDGRTDGRTDDGPSQ